MVYEHFILLYSRFFVLLTELDQLEFHFCAPFSSPLFITHYIPFSPQLSEEANDQTRFFMLLLLSRLCELALCTLPS